MRCWLERAGNSEGRVDSDRRRAGGDHRMARGRGMRVHIRNGECTAAAAASLVPEAEGAGRCGGGAGAEAALVARPAPSRAALLRLRGRSARVNALPARDRSACPARDALRPRLRRPTGR